MHAGAHKTQTRASCRVQEPGFNHKPQVRAAKADDFARSWPITTLSMCIWLMQKQHVQSGCSHGTERQVLRKAGQKGGCSCHPEQDLFSAPRRLLRTVKAEPGLPLLHRCHELPVLCSPRGTAVVSRSVPEPRWVSHCSDARRGGVYSVGVYAEKEQLSYE